MARGFLRKGHSRRKTGRSRGPLDGSGRPGRQSGKTMSLWTKRGDEGSDEKSMNAKRGEGSQKVAKRTA